MSTGTTLIGDRRRQALERTTAQRGHPSRRAQTRPLGPPPTAFYMILLVVVFLIMLGLVMVFSASAITSLHQGNSPWSIFDRQLLWAVLGGVAMVATARIPYHRWRRLIPLIVAAGFGLMLLPFVPGLGRSVNEAKAWVFIGPIGFQPSEFLKLAILLYCADLLARREKDMSNLRRTLWPLMFAAAAAGALCMLQGDLGSAIVIGAIVFAVLFIGGAPLTPMGFMGGVSIATTLAFVFTSQRRFNRFTAFLDITAHKDYLSYQVYQAMIGMATGGVSGTGVGSGPSKWGYLPLAHSDFIFAVIGEELGLIGVVAVIGSFLLLTYGGVQVALAARDRFGSLLAGGIVAWLAVQAVINIGGVSGAMPVTGLTLPFVSSGGSSLFVCMAAAGLLLNVARHVNR
ncbi:MAG: ftsW [Ilumatobacteraceae bacterium]|nr:ftsW [Ilumatobacteraceae bacterium]